MNDTEADTIHQFEVLLKLLNRMIMTVTRDFFSWVLYLLTEDIILILNIKLNVSEPQSMTTAARDMGSTEGKVGYVLKLVLSKS